MNLEALPPDKKRHLPVQLREQLWDIVKRVKRGEPFDDTWANRIKSSVSRFERLLAVDFLIGEGLLQLEVARLFRVDRTAIYEDMLRINEMRRKGIEPAQIFDVWLEGVRYMQDAAATARRAKMEGDDRQAEWTRIEGDMGKALAAEARQLGVSQMMIGVMKEGNTKGVLAKGIPNPLDQNNFLDHVYETFILNQAKEIAAPESEKEPQA